MREPADFARDREERPELPEGTCERVSGYGVMGLPFRSGHVLGLRRWTASSIGESFTSIWHRDPDGGVALASDPPRNGVGRGTGPRRRHRATHRADVERTALRRQSHPSLLRDRQSSQAH
jgi:hypothetical protein